ncbi:MAG TPA: hypothetical protein VII47_10175 [Actinomycetota bacterium]
MARISATSFPGGGRRPVRLDHQTSAVDVEDPELLAATRLTVVAGERVPRFRVDGRDPALEVATHAAGEAAVVSLSLDGQVGYGQFQMRPLSLPAGVSLHEELAQLVQAADAGAGRLD